MYAWNQATDKLEHDQEQRVRGEGENAALTFIAVLSHIGMFARLLACSLDSLDRTKEGKTCESYTFLKCVLCHNVLRRATPVTTLFRSINHAQALSLEARSDAIVCSETHDASHLFAGDALFVRSNAKRWKELDELCD